MDYILAIDQGTSSTRAMLYTIEGQLVCSKQYPITQYYPQPGWVEQDPEEIWEKTRQAIHEVILECHPSQLLACGLTNQRETTLIWDKETGQCVYPAIVWQDRRTEAFCEALTKHAPIINSKTGLLPDPYFSASKLHWVLNHVPMAQKLLEEDRLCFGTIDCFLIWRLTGGASHLTDITNASRTMLFNIHSECWDQDLLALFEVSPSILPQVCSSDAHFGTIREELFGVSIPICGVAGDQQAALIGQRCFSEGLIKATYGTGGFLLLNTGDKPVMSSHQLLTTIAYRIHGKTAYGLEGSMYQAGTSVKWLRDELKMISSAGETEELARGLSSNEGVYFVPSFTGLGAPYWLSTPGALFFGLSRTSNRMHFARAVLESVCYQTFDILSCMHEDSGIAPSLLRVDGGMAVNNWFLQFLASLCGLVVERPKSVETTSLGAAMLAMIGCGLIQSIADLQDRWPCDQTFKVEEHTKADRASDYQGWQKAINMLKLAYE